MLLLDSNLMFSQNVLSEFILEWVDKVSKAYTWVHIAKLSSCKNC